MATPLSRLPEPGDGSPQAAVTISAVTEYLLPATMRGIAVQAMAFSIAAPMYWSNIFSGGYLVVLALAGLATVRRAAR